MGKFMLRRLTGLLLTGLMLSASPLLAAEARLTVTKDQSGREITLKAGDILRIELPGKGGTGYLWALEANGAPYLKLLSETAQTVGEPRPGAPVMQVWRFQAAQPGAGEIKMAYFRPWEGVGKAVDHFRLKFRID